MQITYYPCDTIYIDRIGGTYEVYAHGDGSKHFIMRSSNMKRIERYAKRYHYKIIMVQTV
jgi:hypothetical protein